MEKMEKRAQLLAEMKSLDSKAKEEKRSFSEEETKRFSEVEAEIRSLDIQIAEEKRADTLNGFTTEIPHNDGIAVAEEARAKEFASTGRLEMRAVLASGNIAKPASAGSGIGGLGETGSSIVDDVNSIPLTGTGSWVAAYKASEAAAAAVTDGSAVAGTASTFNYVEITPAEWGVFDQVSKQVKKMSPVAYVDAVKNSALIALRNTAAAKIISGITGSALAEKLYSKTLNQSYLRDLVLNFDGIEGKGEAVLYINKADLATLGAVRGTNEKKAVYEIAFDAGTTKSGVIRDGATAVKFRVLGGLTTGTQLFGQPKTVDMPMWDNYEVSTDEGGEFFKNNVIGIRGIQTANAGLVCYHGMQVIAQAAAPQGGTGATGATGATGE